MLTQRNLKKIWEEFKIPLNPPLEKGDLWEEFTLEKGDLSKRR